MRADKRRRLERAGWRVDDSPREFLGLSKREMQLIDIKISLATEFRRRRAESEISQTDLAGLLGSSQSRVAKMEAADPSVSTDLLIRGLLAMGVTRARIGTCLARCPVL